jgi:hypothetical protein
MTNMIELFHVAPVGCLAAEDELAPRAPANLPELQRQVLKSLVPDGRITPWGESMLADPDWRLHIGDRGLIDFGLASVPGVIDGDRTMHVSGEGRTAMNQTVNRILELIYELVRQLGFRDKPSRLTCVFAYRDFVTAEEYRRLRRDRTTHEIWRLETPADTPTFDADATWTAVAQSSLALLLGCSRVLARHGPPELLHSHGP